MGQQVAQSGQNADEVDTLLLEIESLEDKIQELQLKLRQKDTIIAEKDLVSQVNHKGRYDRKSGFELD